MDRLKTERKIKVAIFTTRYHRCDLQINVAHWSDWTVPCMPVSPRLSGLVRDGKFGSKVGQNRPKWDKSGAF